MKFRVRPKKKYRYNAQADATLMTLIKAKEIFTVVEVRNNHNYLLECKGIKHWFVPCEIIEVRDHSKPINGEYFPVPNFPPYVITKDARMGKLVPDFVDVNTNMAGKITNRRIMVTMYTTEGKKFTKQVAELLLDTFTDHKRNRRVLNYKDGDVTNLSLDNLEYIVRGKKLK